MTIIRAEDISRSFRTGNATIDVLKSINLDMERGTFIYWARPVPVKRLVEYTRCPRQARYRKVFIDDQDITGISERKRNVLRRSKLGFVFQSLALVSNMTAFENIDFALRISKYNGRDRRKRVEECLDFVGLKKRMKHYPGEMSGGEQQRIAIARAVAHKPMLLLADEPTAELDTNTGLRVVKLFKDLVTHDNITVIMCTHDPSMMTVADRIFMLEDGVINDAA